MILGDRLILHDLRGVNLRVGFFLGTKEDYYNDIPCISYSVCWKEVDVRVDQIQFAEQLSELTFWSSKQQLLIDDHVLSGEVINFQCNKENDIITVSCMLLLGKYY